MNPHRMPPPRPNPPPPGGRRPRARALPFTPFSPGFLCLLLDPAALGARPAGMGG